MSERIKGQFVKGQSGNPKGKPPGAGMKLRLERMMTEKGKDGITKGERFIDMLYDAAMGGDTTAMSIIANKLLANAKATIRLSGKGSLTDQGREVLKAMFAGEVEVSEADKALSVLLKQSTIIERVDLEQRLTALEELAGERQIEHVRPAETQTVMWPAKAEPVTETVEALVIDKDGWVVIDV
jgi:hypothetical protein